MNPYSPANYINDLFSEVDKLLNNYVSEGYHALSTYLAIPLALTATIYIVIMGICITQGWVRLSMANLVKSAMTIGLVYMLAMNWDFFSYYIVDFLNSLATELGNVLVKASPMPMPQSAGSGINGALQSTLDQYINLTQTLWGKTHLLNPQPIIGAVIILVSGFMQLGIGIAEIVIAKVMLALLLATAPMIIPLAFFKTTKGIVDRWQGYLVGFTLLLIFISAALALATSLNYWAIDPIEKNLGGFNFSAWGVLVIISIINIAIIMKVGQMAMVIGSSMSSSAGSSMVAGALGAAIGVTMMMPGVRTMMKLAMKAKSAAGGKAIGLGSAAISGIKNKLRKGE